MNRPCRRTVARQRVRAAGWRATIGTKLPYDQGTLVAIFVAYAIFGLVFLIFALIMNWRIAKKAGYSGALSLLMLVPFVNFIVICLFAFTEWPIERALKTARGESSGGPPAWTPPGDGGTYLPLPPS